MINEELIGTGQGLGYYELINVKEMAAITSIKMNDMMVELQMSFLNS
jgi:hypothetical protein